METKEVIEKKDPYIEVSYILAKSEKFPKEEMSVKITMPYSGDDIDMKATKEMIKKEVEIYLQAAKEAVKENM